LARGTGIGSQKVANIVTANHNASLPQTTAQKLMEMMLGIVSRFDAQ
jgi:hypothetical protein